MLKSLFTLVVESRWCVSQESFLEEVSCKNEKSTKLYFPAGVILLRMFSSLGSVWWPDAVCPKWHFLKPLSRWGPLWNWTSTQSNSTAGRSLHYTPWVYMKDTTWTFLTGISGSWSPHKGLSSGKGFTAAAEQWKGQQCLRVKDSFQQPGRRLHLALLPPCTSAQAFQPLTYDLWLK